MGFPIPAQGKAMDWCFLVPMSVHEKGPVFWRLSREGAHQPPSAKSRQEVPILGVGVGFNAFLPT